MASRTRAEFAAEVKAASKANTKTGAELQAAMRRAFLKLGTDAKRIIVQTLAGCFSQLQAGTPYDTGRAQAGWLMSGEGDKAVSFIPGEKQPVYEPTKPDEAALLRTDIIYVVNNVSYILFLEAGWSKRQPGGFVARFLADAKRKLDEACAFMSTAR